MAASLHTYSTSSKLSKKKNTHIALEFLWFCLSPWIWHLNNKLIIEYKGFCINTCNELQMQKNPITCYMCYSPRHVALKNGECKHFQWNTTHLTDSSDSDVQLNTYWQRHFTHIVLLPDSASKKKYSLCIFLWFYLSPWVWHLNNK